MTDKERMKEAFDHGRSCMAYSFSSLPKKYAPLTFDAWYDKFIKENGKS